MSQNSLPNDCRLGPTSSNITLDDLMKKPDFGNDVRSMKSWTEVKLALPGDATLEGTLLRIGRDDPTADDDLYLNGLRRTMYDRYRNSACRMTKLDVRSVTDSAMQTVFTGMNFELIYEYFLAKTEESPADAFYPSIYGFGLDKYGMRLLRTVDNEVGHIQSVQFACHRAGCKRTFQEGDAPVLDDNRNWCHPLNKDRGLGFVPALTYPKSGCTGGSCEASFSGHPVALYSVFGSLPKHLFHIHGEPFTCDGTRAARARRIMEDAERASEERLEGGSED